jgi:superfamily I DNA/RNA helicase/RecB family exonuclease
MRRESGQMTLALTPEQRRIVEWGDGPLVVIAGAGTGKTRVIVERVRYLLEHRDGLLPENLLVLTYNVQAARELQERLDQVVGTATRARMSVSNFHSFCQRILTESAADAGLPPRPDVLDGVAQVLLLKDIRPNLQLIYHSDWWLSNFVQFINRAKDELVGPDDFDAFVAQERRIFEERNGSFDVAAARLESQGNLRPLRAVRGAYAWVRTNERLEDRGEGPDYDPLAADKAADREARRTVAGTGRAVYRSQIHPDDHPRIDTLAATYVIDGAALEVLRLTELAAVYRAYETELARRGALDFGEQIAAVTKLFKTRPNVLRRWQRQFRYLLVDEFQDANVAQIELIELLGRTPDRPDNVMVVGDDDQSIYRFRGASFAAFAEFDARFARPPAYDPDARPPGPPPRLRIERNFRSVGHVLTAANRLIARNETRFEPDKRLRTDRPDGEPIDLLVCAGAEDEAVAIVDTIKSMVGEGTGGRWTDVAVLYRKHKHREAIVARLRDEDIPYTVVGGLSLFETPEIRDLEQAMRAITDPHDDVALVRMMTAGPWRLDALEILRVTRMARFDRAHLLETVKAIVESGRVEVDQILERREDGPATAEVDAAAGMRAKLRQLLGALDELNPLTFREGPHTILERFLERTGQVLDLIAADTLESKRTVTNIASFMRFAADWQAANPNGTLAGFVAYLDAYQAAGGELPTSVELSEDVDGVRLMTLYQAKGLEFPIVFVPNLLDGEWPTKEMGEGLFPRDLLREAVPAGDIHTDEERRLLYVAMTRAQDRLILTTHGGPVAAKEASRFIGEILDGAGSEVRRIDRTATTAAAAGSEGAGSDDSAAAGEDGVDRFEGTLGLEGVFGLDGGDDGSDIYRQVAALRRVMPLPSARERRLALRLRASELVGLMEATATTDPETPAARDDLAAELATIARSAATTADEARAQGLDPLTFRTLALDDGAGANLLQVAPLPRTHSYSSLSTYERCPLQYAFNYVYRMPPREEPVAAFTFGSTAHEAFEAFTRERRERIARGDPPPNREDLEREFRARWTPTGFGDKTTEEGYQRRVATLLDNFWAGEVSSLSEALREEEPFELTLEPDDGSAPVVITGSIDRIDRLASGGIDVIDYKTGRVSSQKGVDESLQLSIYALACRDGLGLGTPERVTLYFTESALRLSTTRSDEQLDLARADVLARVARLRAGEFAATPGDPCRWCDYRAMCPERES